jgi:hypothetical protein
MHSIPRLSGACLALTALLPLAAVAQGDTGWQACAAQIESGERLA